MLRAPLTSSLSFRVRELPPARRQSVPRSFASVREVFQRRGFVPRSLSISLGPERRGTGLTGAGENGFRRGRASRPMKVSQRRDDRGVTFFVKRK